MITEFGLGVIAQKKVEELNKLRTIKMTNPNYRIIDVGGGKEKHVSDKFDFIDACVDMREVNHPGVKHFQGNINDPELWEDIHAEVAENGKFDYCICTHTLEDLSSPAYVARQISKIAKSGIVSFPSKYKEMCRFEFGPESYRGYNHHRWIMTIQDGSVLALPKINLVEAPHFDQLTEYSSRDREELYALWNDNLDFKIINNDWLGPSPRECFEMYYNTLYKTDEDGQLL